MARKIVITSGKGGVGKTSITANLGMALAKKALRVAVVDLDLTLNNLDVAFKAENKVLFDMYDVINGRCRIKQALIQDKTIPSLFLMPCSHKGDKVISNDDVANVISKMNDLFDYILIDCPAGIDSGFNRAVSVADEAIVICTPHLSSIRDASKVISILNTLYKLIDIRVVVNRMRGDLVVSGNMLDAFEVFSLLECKPLGIIPEDDEINCFGKCDENNNAFTILAENIHNGKMQMLDCVSQYRKLFGRAKKKRGV